MISISLSNPSKIQKDRKTRSKKGKTTSGKLSKVGAKTFEEMGRNEQDKYLDTFPQSSHKRIQIKQIKNKIGTKSNVRKKVKAAKDVVGTKAKEMFPKKVPQERYNSMDAKTQKIYDSRFEGNNKFSSIHHAIKKPNITQKRVVEINGAPTTTQTRKEKKEKKALEDAGRQQAQAHFNESLSDKGFEAAAGIKPEHIRETAKNLAANKDKILPEIEASLRKDSEKPYAKDDVGYKGKKQKSRSAYDVTKLPGLGKPIDDKTFQIGFDADGKPIEGKYEDYPDAARGDLDEKKLPGLGEHIDDDRFLVGYDDEGQRIEDTYENHPEAYTKAQPKKKGFFSKDMETLGKILKGEEVDPGGRGNAMTALTIFSRYALMAGGVYMVAMGGGPLALSLAKTVSENWSSFNTLASDDKDSDTLSKVYDTLVDHLKHMDYDEFASDLKGMQAAYEKQKLANAEELTEEEVTEDGAFVEEELKEEQEQLLEGTGDEEAEEDEEDSEGDQEDEDVGVTRRKEVAKILEESMESESSASRISYRSLPQERTTPIDIRTHWDMFQGGVRIGSIVAELEEGKTPSQQLRIWKPILYGQFNEFDFPHMEREDLTNVREPYIVTNDEDEDEHQLELHHPTLMNLAEARKFMHGVIKSHEQESNIKRRKI